VTVKLDKVRPTVSGVPVVRLTLNGVIRDIGAALNTAQVSVSGWTGVDALSGVDRYWLELSEDGGPFTTLTLESPTATATARRLEPGSNYQFQVRAVDVAGLTTRPAQVGADTAVDLFHDNDAAITYTGAWVSQASSSTIGGVARTSDTALDEFTFAFTGTGAAWISSRGTNRGMAEVYVDGVLQTTLDLYAATTQGKRQVFVVNDLPAGPHTIRVVVTGTANPSSTDTRVFNDGFVVLS
jgi:hypothetical protein